ncbi:MAG: sodium:calcium symporter [Kiritimatiellales bacterium]|nr:sodium:calcium symporter [Kiritimatiellota bacterium]MBL7011492.1 sodium:calcium symporter [Kiritimatiellales bacterium]
MDYINDLITIAGWGAPFICVLLFLLASLLVVWRLEVLSGKGVEGTVLGTIFMPFCSGMGNIIFALVLATNQGDGRDVLINCLFNNVANLTVLIGAPVLIWSMASIPRRKTQAAMREHKAGRLSLVLNLVAALFFSLFVWLLAADGVVSRTDGFVLLALFVFWQCFHVYDVKKTNLLNKKAYPKTLPCEVVLLLIGAFAVFISTDWLVCWFQTLESGGTRPYMLGWLSGLLMVLPNALLAFYYGARNRMDVVYTSQSGDAHICIPLCIGIFAAFRPIASGEFLQHTLLILMGLCAVHLLFVAVAGRLPRVVAALLMAAFGWFLWSGLA